MTAPNEPGPGDGPNAATDSPGQHAGQRSGTGRADDGRQRGPARPRKTPPRPPEAQPPGQFAGVDPRTQRLGAPAAPGGPPLPGDAEPAQRTDTYRSELPDLSEPRAGEQRRPAPPRVEVRPGPPGPVRASMQIRRVDPWSTLKISLLLSVALFFVWMFAVAVLYLLLGSMGVWSKLNSNVGDLLENSGGAGELVSTGTIFGGATLIGLVNIVVLTAMATLGAVIYNLSTDVVGGVEVTLADRD